MRLDLRNRVPSSYNAQTWQDIVTKLQNQINQLSEGQLVAKHNAQSSVPTTGSYAVGDFVANSTQSELGSAASKYVLMGWTCTVSDPLTFVEIRCLTGN
jgi:hypothetical protein